MCNAITHPVKREQKLIGASRENGMGEVGKVRQSNNARQLRVLIKEGQ